MKEPHKIYLRKEVWNALTSIAEKEGKTIDEVIASLINEKYAWGIPEPPKNFNNNNKINKGTIVERLKELVAQTYIRNASKEEYSQFEVYYCGTCNYLTVVSRYSISPRICLKEHKLTPLGTLNNFI